MSRDGENVAICYVCNEVFEIENLEPYHCFWSRAEVGEVMPAGDCPNCGSFCYLDQGPGSSFRVELDDEVIQLKDRHGEIVSWHIEEWKEDPMVVFAVVNAILRGIYESPAALREIIGKK